jgi:hypothetical protein
MVAGQPLTSNEQSPASVPRHFIHYGLTAWLRTGAVAAFAAVLWCACAGSTAVGRGPAPDQIAGSPGLRIVAGHFVAAGDLGRGANPNLMGQTVEADGVRLRIDAAIADPDDPSGAIVLYRFSRIAADGTATPYCHSGGGLGFPMAGSWSAHGEHFHAPGKFTIACIGSAEARCVALGYRPWATGPDGTSLWDYHQACVRALRADYCGTGHSHGGFGNGLLALYDRLGVRPLQGAAGMSFEAAWGVNGASCVNHIRAPAHMSLRDLTVECANLPKTRLGNSCDERDPALIFTKSPASPRH